MISKPPPSELRNLVDRLLDGETLARTEMARLEELLESPENLAYYLSITTQEALLPEALASVKPAAARERKVIPFPIRIAAMAAAACVVFFIGFQVGETRRKETSQSVAVRNAPRVQITGLVGVEWKADAAPDLSGNVNRRLAFRTGLAELTYTNGVRVTLEGPADLTVTGDNAARLDAGRLVASVPKGAEGFVVDYAGGRVVDLGTEFGLDVTRPNKTELGVFEGKVELHRPGAEVLSLQKNQAVLLDPTADVEVSAIPLNRDKFVRQIPNRDFRWEVTTASPMQVEYDVSHLVVKPATYRALFKWMQGQDAVYMSHVQLCLDGTPVSTNPTSGTTGTLRIVSGNLFELPVSKEQFRRGKWTVRATLQTLERQANFEPKDAPVHSLGILQFEEGLVTRATAEDFIGTWAYTYAGIPYERIIRPDGTIGMRKNGKDEPTGFPGGRWQVENGVLQMVDPVKHLFEDQVLRDAETLIFVNRPYENAKKVSGK